MTDSTNPEGTGSSFDLGATPYVPTQPASQFLGLSQPEPAIPPAESQYAVYEPTPVAPVQPVPLAYPQPAPQVPAQQYGTPQLGPMLPSQIVPTQYGNFAVGNKSKMTAGVLGIVLGGLGAGQFYRGNVGLGIAQLAVSIVTLGAGWIWGFVEGILVIVSKPGTALSLDSNGRLMS